MSRTCALCGKSAVRANNVSHSNIKTPRRQKPNLQSLAVGAERLRVCSACRRAARKQAA